MTNYSHLSEFSNLSIRAIQNSSIFRTLCELSGFFYLFRHKIFHSKCAVFHSKYSVLHRNITRNITRNAFYHMYKPHNCVSLFLCMYTNYRLCANSILSYNQGKGNNPKTQEPPKGKEEIMLYELLKKSEYIESLI